MAMVPWITFVFSPTSMLGALCHRGLHVEAVLMRRPTPSPSLLWGALVGNGDTPEGQNGIGQTSLTVAILFVILGHHACEWARVSR